VQFLALLSFFRKDLLEIELTSSADKVNFMNPDKARSLEDFPEEIKCKDNGPGKICFKDARGARLSSDGNKAT
jgi:hypothetical protein